VRSIYSFLDALDQSPGAARSQLQYQPRHRVSLENRWDVARSTLARAEVSWVGRESYYSRTLPVTGRTLKPYTLVDVDVTRSLAGSRMSLTAGITNALDVYHESPYVMPQPGRTLYVSLGTRLGR
jgi:outer membrane receptor for ferrienterochelin and colicin